MDADLVSVVNSRRVDDSPRDLAEHLAVRGKSPELRHAHDCAPNSGSNGHVRCRTVRIRVATRSDIGEIRQDGQLVGKLRAAVAHAGTLLVYVGS